MRLLLTVLVLAIDPQLACANLLLLESTGADVGDCRQAPCLSLSYAISQVQPLDTIRMGAGIFKGSLNRNLNPGSLGKSNFTIEGQAAETIIDLENLGRFMLLDAAAGHVTIQKLSITRGNCAALVGNEVGAGFALIGSPARLRDLRISRMECSSHTISPLVWNGAAIYLKDSTASLQNLEVTDCISNHGSGVASWGDDRSIVEDSIFERHEGLQWGGTMLMDENSATEFHRCRFSYGTASYGGILDDGGNAAPLYKDCIFEHGRAVHGGGYYGYGNSRSRFVNTEFRYGFASSSGGGVYMTAQVIPTFVNVTFFNNSAGVEAGALRSYVAGELAITNARFIRNSAPSDSAMQVSAGYLAFEAVDFEENVATAKGGAISLGSDAATLRPSTLRRVRFLRNKARFGGGLSLHRGVSNNLVHHFILEDGVFEGNEVAESGGAIQIRGGFRISLTNVTFLENRAMQNGGAISIQLIEAAPAVIEMNDSIIESSHADSHGGAIHCSQVSGESVALDLRRVSFRQNDAYGNGGGIFYGCQYLKITNSSFVSNLAAGNGGALHLGPELRCTQDVERVSFEDVEFHHNVAKMGAATFFDTDPPTCAIPYVEGFPNVFDGSKLSVWSWANFNASVSGNVAVLGNLQATTPVRIKLVCAGTSACASTTDGLALQGFPGVALAIEAMLEDSFEQLYIDDTLIVELWTADPHCFLEGVQQHRLQQGVAVVQSLQVLSVVSEPWKSNCDIVVRVPLSIFALRSVQGAKVQVNLGVSPSACPSGWISENATAIARECKACPPGTFGSAGSKTCQVCPIGTYTATGGLDQCDECPVGHGCPAGTSMPAPCAPGFFQDNRGKENCFRCPHGKYAPDHASATCSSCGMGLITPESGSVSQDDCVCAEGKFMVAGVGCRTCFEGMVCLQGLAPPEQKAGYWAEDLGAGDYSVLLCRNPNECPQGEPELCAPNRRGPACNNCLPSYYPTSAGACSPCGSFDWLPFYAALVGMWALAALLITRVNAELTNSNLNKLTIAAVANQLCFVIQTFSTIRQLHINWPEPVKSLVDIANLITMLDLDFLKIACVSQYDHPAVKLTGQLLAFPLLAFGVSSIWMIHHVLRRTGIPYDHVFNILGLVLFAFSLSLSLTSLMPFQCLPNPNGTGSMANNPGVICYESADHWILMGIGAFGILMYPVSIVSWAAWTTYQYPTRAATGNGLTLLYRYRFFFQRFKQTCYGFGLFVVVRNFLLALAPIVLVPFPALQIPTVGLFLLVSLVVQVRFWPWRTRVANVADALMTGFLIITLAGVAPLLDVSETEATLVLGTLLCVPVLAPLVIGLIAVIWSGWRDVRSVKKWDIFLCHHKGGGGALARYVKIMLCKTVQCKVFLDADSLQNLDQLFDTVRDQTQHFVVLLTQQLLKRMWCAGEIATAFKHHITMIPVACDDFRPLRTQEIDRIPAHWGPEQQHSLACFGIRESDITSAFLHLQALLDLRMPRFGTSAAKLLIIREILSRCQLVGTGRVSMEEANGVPATRPRILIAGAVADAEALSTCEVAEELIQQRLQVPCSVVRAEDEASVSVQYASYVVVILSKGLLRDPSFAKIMMAVFTHKRGASPTGPNRSMMSSRGSDRDLNLVTVTADSRFEFPAMDFYQEISESGLGMGEEFGQKLEKIYRFLLQLLALPLSPHGSQGLIEKQIHEICGRFPRYKDGMSGVALDEEADRAAATEDLSFSPGGRPGSEITGSMDTTLFGRLPSLVQSGGGSAGYNLNDISEVSEEDEADLGHLQSIRGEHLPSDHGDGSATSEPREEEISEYF